MKFSFDHNNINVTDLERTIGFYEQALGLKVESRHKAADGSFELAFLTDGGTGHKLELTWLADHGGAYDLGENEFHMALRTDDFDAAHKLHEAMGCICYENTEMGLYFIHDPDDYWIEILPKK